MVRLKAFAATTTGIGFLGFNSLMVRLKEHTEKRRKGVHGQFQFPNGSIKRYGTKLRVKVRVKVSIP